jgi:hypothetical protein
LLRDTRFCSHSLCAYGTKITQATKTNSHEKDAEDEHMVHTRILGDLLCYFLVAPTREFG